MVELLIPSIRSAESVVLYILTLFTLVTIATGAVGAIGAIGVVGVVGAVGVVQAHKPRFVTSMPACWRAEATKSLQVNYSSMLNLNWVSLGHKNT